MIGIIKSSNLPQVLSMDHLTCSSMGFRTDEMPREKLNTSRAYPKAFIWPKRRWRHSCGTILLLDSKSAKQMGNGKKYGTFVVVVSNHPAMN
jgi:hypothetical protein